MLSTFSIFDPKKVPRLSTHELPFYGDGLIQILIGQLGRDLPAKSLEGSEFEKAALSLQHRVETISSVPY